METVFPVMYWVHNYSVPGYTSGWYLPARDELELILQNVTELNQALGKVTSFTIGNTDYWASSFYLGGYGNNYGIYYGNPGDNPIITCTWITASELYYGIPVHVFN